MMMLLKQQQNKSEGNCKSTIEPFQNCLILRHFLCFITRNIAFKPILHRQRQQLQPKIEIRQISDEIITFKKVYEIRICREMGD